MLNKLVVAYQISITSIVSREKLSSATNNGKFCISCSVKGASIIFVKSFIANYSTSHVQIKIVLQRWSMLLFRTSYTHEIFIFITLSQLLFLSQDASMLCYICNGSLPRWTCAFFVCFLGCWHYICCFSLLL